MPSTVSADELRHAMRRFASGVTIVTSIGKDGPAGITVSSFTSISLDPAVVMVALNKESSLSDAVMESHALAIHVLSSEQEPLSVRFADTGDWHSKLGGVSWTNGLTGAPILQVAHTVIEARVIQSVEVGSHLVIFGAVLSTLLDKDVPETPLLYYDRNYRTLDQSN